MFVKKRHPFSYILTTRFKLRLIAKMLEKTEGKSLLDIGCGSGFILSQIENKFKKVIGIDVSAKALNIAKKFTTARLIRVNAQKLPFKNSSFDYIIGLDVFEHLKDDKKAILEVKRILKPKGHFIIYVPCQQGILAHTGLTELFHKNKKNYLKDQRYYTLSSLKRLVKKAGLKIEFVAYHNVFFQEFFTQLLKWGAFKLGKKYDHQGDIGVFTDSLFFPFYRWFLLPVVDFLVFLEELICEKILQSKIPGHRIIIKCQKTNG